MVKKRKKIKKLNQKKKTRKKPAKRIVRKTAKRKTSKPKASRKRKKPAKRTARKTAKPKASRKRKKPAKKRKSTRKTRKKTVSRKTSKTTSPLEQLFESTVKIQIMKLFFRNPDQKFLLKDIVRKIKTPSGRVSRELNKLEKANFLNSKKISPRKTVFLVNSDFVFFKELQDLVLKTGPVSIEKMLRSIKRLGKISLVLVSGIFSNYSEAKADLLIVGDKINKRKLKTFISNIEAEAGTEINCVIMSTDEFNYRYDMYDRFVRDLLDEKSELLLNKLGF